MTPKDTDGQHARVTVGAVAVSPGERPTIDIEGTFEGAPPVAVELIGPRARISTPVTVDGTHWRARVSLLLSRWHSPELPLPSGAYRVEAVRADAASAPLSHVQVASLPPLTLLPEVCRVSFGTAAGGDLVVEISAPLTDAELGPAAQDRLEAQYRATRPPLENAVFFESFYGQSVSCNPLGIDRELARTRPDVTRYWSVADASVAVPAGAIPLIDGSEEWWRVRGSARLLVVNDWLRKRFRRRRGQTVLQTWHGTPLKKIALNRSGIGPRAVIATLMERARWNILLTQNRYTTRTFRTAYAFIGRAWELGYPRNDVLAVAAKHADSSAALRERLGIAQDATVVLYAPTWRDDRPEEVDHLDVASFTRALGPTYVTLLRGHSRSLQPGNDVEASNVVDVTSYPEVSELFLIADVLVTDYSSVMFDFSVTGKPIYFFAPDLEDYRNELRGFYFDLLELAPGPVVQTSDDLVRVVRDGGDEQAKRFASRYAAWTKRFNPWDDGAAAERVVARIMAEGILR